MNKAFISLVLAATMLFGVTSGYMIPCTPEYDLSCENLEFSINVMEWLYGDAFQLNTIALNGWNATLADVCGNLPGLLQLREEEAAAKATTEEEPVRLSFQEAVENVKARSKFRKSRQTAYSDIYSSFLQIDLDTDKTSKRKSKRIPPLTYEEVDNGIRYPLCWIARNYPLLEGEALEWAKDYCDNILFPYFYSGVFPNNGNGTDLLTPRTLFREDSALFMWVVAYMHNECIF